MSAFCKHVMTDPTPVIVPLQKSPSFSMSGFKSVSNLRGRRNSKRQNSLTSGSGSSGSSYANGDGTGSTGTLDGKPRRRSSLQAVKRSVSVLVNGGSSTAKKNRSSSVPREDEHAVLDEEAPPLPSSPMLPPAIGRGDSDLSATDVGGPRMTRSPSPLPMLPGENSENSETVKYAGDPVYGVSAPPPPRHLREDLPTIGPHAMARWHDS